MGHPHVAEHGPADQDLSVRSSPGETTSRLRDYHPANYHFNSTHPLTVVLNMGPVPCLSENMKGSPRICETAPVTPPVAVPSVRYPRMCGASRIRSMGGGGRRRASTARPVLAASRDRDPRIASGCNRVSFDYGHLSAALELN